jgi:hypothetical protein
LAVPNTENKKSWRRHKITGAVIVAYAVIVGIILYYQGTEMFFRTRYAVASAVIFIIVFPGAWIWTSAGSAQSTDHDQDRNNTAD